VRSLVEIFCAEESHNGKVTKLHMFRVCRDGYALNATQGRRVSKAELAAYWDDLGLDPDSLEPDVRTLMGPNEHVQGDHKGKKYVEHKDERRERYEIECPVCGLKVVVRGENAAPVFEKLRRAGVQRISLKAFAARLS